MPDDYRDRPIIRTMPRLGHERRDRTYCEDCGYEPHGRTLKSSILCNCSNCKVHRGMCSDYIKEQAWPERIGYTRDDWVRLWEMFFEENGELQDSYPEDPETLTLTQYLDGNVQWKEIEVCGRCNLVSWEEDMTVDDAGRNVCRRHRPAEHHCSLCDTTHRGRGLYAPNTLERVCRSCFDERWQVCFFCSQTRPLTEIRPWPTRNDGEQALCDRCYENRVFECPQCGEETFGYEGEPQSFCQACRPWYKLWNYSHKPPANWLFGPTPDVWRLKPDNSYWAEYYPEDNLFVGLEIETVRVGDWGRETQLEWAAKWSKFYTEEERFFYLKSDATVTGPEIVTHPMTPEFGVELFPWKAISDVRNYGLKGFHDENAPAGMHIHVSKAAFDSSHMWKFLQFHYRNPGFCQFVGQRFGSQYARFNKSAIATDRKDCKSIALKKLVGQNRSFAINTNTTRAETIELRYPVANLKPERIKKNIEFIRALYEYTKILTSQEIKEGVIDSPRDFIQFVRKQDRWPYLMHFLNDRLW